jgi:Tol biopolymer transport system component
MDTTLAPGGARPRIASRVLLLALAAILVLVTLAAVAIVGSRNRTPAPFGLADNGQLAYVQDGDIYVRQSLDAPGRLLIGSDATDGWPYFAPDGTRMAFTRIEGTQAYDYFANADGTGLVRALPDPIEGDGYWAWAPASDRLAIIHEVHGRGILHIANVDGAPVDVVDLSGLSVTDAVWLPPDGDRLLIRAMRFAPPALGTVDLYTVNADGTDLRPLGLPATAVFGGDWDNSGPSVAPDGARIAYNRVLPRQGQDPDGTFRVFLANPDGTGEVAVPGPGDDAVNEAWPAWSPDGKWILVHRWTWKTEPDGGYGWLAVMPADGSAPARDIGPRIPGGEDTGLAKFWSPDGSRVLVQAANEQKVYSVDVATGAYEELPWTTELPDWQRTAS